jgi:DNA-binding NarL/FixJ family response regulator
MIGVVFRTRRPKGDRSSTSVVKASRKPVVVTAFPLKGPGRAQLAAQLGDVEILDMRDAVSAADLVLAPSCSPQCISALKGAYPTARVVVVELDDRDFNVSLPGPVKRVLNAGADAYLLADSIEELAQQLQRRHPHPFTEETAVSELAQPSVDDVILANVEAVLAQREKNSASPAGTKVAHGTGHRPVA